jgi:tRNA threonylcarbamoyladenosine biosynthesis protein TsaB
MKKTLYLEKSVGSARGGEWVRELDLEGVERIVVGIGPGSFAGIRSALSFAEGYGIATGCEVFGLPSPAAMVREGDGPLAVVGDARQGKFWIALFDGFRQIGEVRLVDGRESLDKGVPRLAKVVSPDDGRIGEVLAELFGERYEPGRLPDAEGLKRFAEAAGESSLVREPRPIYLNPAVRN